MTLVLIRDDDAPTIVERVPQGEARREHTLRDLIYDNPTILPVRDIDPGYGRLFTVARELNVPGVGFIDVLLADEHELDYNQLDGARSGVEAQDGYLEAIHPATPSERRELLRGGLLNYCRLDTMAMVVALERLRLRL